MRSVKHPNFFKQDNGYTTTLTLADFGAQLYEERFNVSPLDVPTCGASEDPFESALVLPLHAEMVPRSGTALTKVIS